MESQRRRPPHANPLPPYGRAWLELVAGLGFLGQSPRVAIGARAWRLAMRAISAPIMVLPSGADPVSFAWPVRGRACFLIDTGDDLPLLERTAWALLRDGAPLVLPLRIIGRGGSLPEVLRPYVEDNYGR